MMRSTRLALMAAIMGGVNPSLLDDLITPKYPSDKKEFGESDVEALSKAEQKRARNVK